MEQRAFNVPLINERALLDCRVKEGEVVSFIISENRNIIILANLKNSQSPSRWLWVFPFNRTTSLVQLLAYLKTVRLSFSIYTWHRVKVQPRVKLAII